MIDWLGKEWGVGDKIIYLTSLGNQGAYNIAEVLSIEEVQKDYTYTEGLKITVRPILQKTSRGTRSRLFDDQKYYDDRKNNNVILKKTSLIMRYFDEK